jgi:polyisoprenoid-binding protein YceI
MFWQHLVHIRKITLPVSLLIRINETSWLASMSRRPLCAYVVAITFIIHFIITMGFVMAQWILDPAHSGIKFKVKHLVVSTVTGQFTSVRGSVQASKPDFSDASIQFEADVDSISTNNEQRDGHLKSIDFFDAANHPKLSFVSTGIIRKGEGSYQLKGDMTIRGTKKSITLDVTHNGTVKGFEGDVAGFEISGTLNRQDFGLRWNAMTEAGGVVVSNEVKLDIAVELKAAQVAQSKAA